MRNIIFEKDNIILDSGYFFARGVFETILVKDKPIFLDEHINRLNKGINILEIGESIDIEYINNIIKELNISNCAFKIVVTEKNIVFATRELTYKDQDYLHGFSLKVSKIIRNSKSKLTYIKSINYLENIIQREDALKDGYNEALFLNEKGYVCEGSISNIFIVKGGRIFTPKVENGLLEGIIREYVIKTNDVVEKELTLEEVRNADEIFITNSLLGIMGINKFEGRVFTENKITMSIREKYEDIIKN